MKFCLISLVMLVCVTLPPGVECEIECDYVCQCWDKFTKWCETPPPGSESDGGGFNKCCQEKNTYYCKYEVLKNSFSKFDEFHKFITVKIERPDDDDLKDYFG